MERNVAELLVDGLARRAVGHAAYVALKLSGIEMPRSVQRGRNLRLPHGAVGLVVHPSTVIGDDVRLYQGVTIGRSDTHLPRRLCREGGGVVIGSRVVIGANAVVLFRSGSVVRIGEGAVIGAGSVVLGDIPPREIWAGNPARRVGTAVA